MAKMLFEVWVDRAGNEFSSEVSIENDIIRTIAWKDATLVHEIWAQSDDDFLNQHHRLRGSEYRSVCGFGTRSFTPAQARRQKEYIAERSVD